MKVSVLSVRGKSADEVSGEDMASASEPEVPGARCASEVDWAVLTAISMTSDSGSRSRPLAFLEMASISPLLCRSPGCPCCVE